MSFGNQPADGAGNIMSSAVPDGTTTPYAVAGGPSYADSGNTKTTVQVYVADGNNVTQGAKGDSAATNSTSSWSVTALLKGLYAKLAGTLTVGGSVSVSNFPATQPVSSTDGSQATTGTTTDAAYTSGAGSVISILKGIFTRLAALASLGTDQTGTELRASLYGKNATAGDTAVATDASGNMGVNVIGALPAGTNTIGKVNMLAAGSALAVDNTNELRTSLYGKVSAAGDTPLLLDALGRVLIGRSAATLYSLASGAQTASGNSGDLAVGPYTEIAIDLQITAESGTTPTLQFFWDRKGADGNYYPLWQSSQLTASTTLTAQISTAIGAGMAYNQSLGSTGRLRWVIGGTTPSWTLSASVIGK